MKGAAMRIAAFDIETTNLTALMGGLLCVSFKPIAISEEFTRESEICKPYTLRLDDRKYKGSDWEDDSKLVDGVLRELETYDIIQSWNGKLFDIKFLKAKCLEYGLRPPHLRWHLDSMWTVRNGMRIGSSKLVNVQKFLGLEEEKTQIAWKDWRRAARGVHEALDIVVDHCERDVEVTATCYWRLLPYVKQLRMDG